MRTLNASVVLTVMLLVGCEPTPPPADTSGDLFAPTPPTVSSNQRVREALPFENRRDFEDARRGLIASMEEPVIYGRDGKPIWDMTSYGFIEGDAPASVNPSLWRQAELNNIHGLFEVTEGIYQLRGYDLANMSVIRGETGWILVDPLTAMESAEQVWAFAQEHLGARPVSAIIFTHSHMDHFGGVLGITGEDGNPGLRIIAPEGFMEEATSENLLAGAAMARRSNYMMGASLERSPRGHVDTGLGKGLAFGYVSVLKPTDIIDSTPQALTVDGVDFVFQNVPGSEAPAELTFYLPKHKAFCGAELVSRNMHNVLTLRGAKVRDALKWSDYIDEAIHLFPETEVYFASHHWPLWGGADIVDFLEKQRDGYKFIHDQTLRMANQGMTSREIAESLRMPPTLAESFPNRGYYGTASHNAKAVYQFYFGWYDGNPANLNPLPPEQAAQRYVTAMGGSGHVLTLAKSAYRDGDYRWTAELLNHLVFANPNNSAARELLARSYHQLGYQAEAGTWRDIYLTGALELLHGVTPGVTRLATIEPLLRNTPLDRFFTLMAVLLNGERAADSNLVIRFHFTDIAETWQLNIKNAVLHSRQLQEDSPLLSSEVNASVSLTHNLLIEMLTGQAGVRDLVFSDELSVSGSKLDLVRFFGLLDSPQTDFAIVTP
jgi:alkyl sulfatase BDS1-like metallo-beta-lactamase superfamily hydrolase